MLDQEVAAHLIKSWPALPHGEVFVRHYGKYSYVCLAAELEAHYLLHSVCIGAHGGLTEDILLLSQPQPNGARKVVVNATISPTEDRLLNSRMLRGQIARAEGTALEVCQVQMEWLRADLLTARPGLYLVLARAAKIGRVRPQRVLRQGLPLIPRPRW